MQRYFIEKEQWFKTFVSIVNDDYHHIKNVMRMHQDDKIICVHPNGNAALCRIRQINEQEIIANITDWLKEEKELPIFVTIVQGLPKKNKLEFILQKGTELGAHQFCLYQADRSIVQWDEKKKQQKIARYEKIVKEASEQCHRHHIPGITSLPSLDTLLKDQINSFDVVLFAYEEEAKKNQFTSFSHILKHLKAGQHICICIGPEGGFSEKEVYLLKEYEAMSVRLGPRILRTETASLYALASISYHFEELGC